MSVVRFPQTSCRAAVTRADITPPIGIYHRMWGAATHDRATGIHKPLFATLLWLEPTSGNRSHALLLLALDHCILDQPDVALLQQTVAETVGVQSEQVLVTLSHTHAAGLMSRTRSQLPGGELIAPYLDSVARTAARLASEAAAAVKPATFVYGHGRSSLAAHRDYFDVERQQFVCGLNPAGPADDTVLVAMIQDEREQLLATIVNYACHPTTLAWQNTLISPDYVGALRETVEREFRAPCLFLQGASGDLGPRHGFVGDPTVADANGIQLGFAVLSALTTLPKPGLQFAYTGPQVSGATIGTWQFVPEEMADADRNATWHLERWCEPLEYRPDLPTLTQAQMHLEDCRRRESEARAAGQTDLPRDHHARVEQATRQLWRLEALPPSAFPLNITLARLGDAIWLFVPGEHYQSLQTTLRASFPDQPLIVATLTGWQPGYIPPAETYGRGIYQEQIAVVAAGSAEQIIAAISERIRDLLAA
jgi:hypothetical protein